jgi:hypothetical protein
MKRILFDIVLFLSAFIFPWWISILLLFIGIFLFKNFYEFIIDSIIIYSLYFIKEDSIISSPLFFYTTTIILFTIISLLRNNIIIYKNDF